MTTMSTLKMCCLAAEDAKKHGSSATADAETLHKSDKHDTIDELTTKFQQSVYGQR